jgi:glucuronoarabinoxylan endo-1,4-beta-xylanase
MPAGLDLKIAGGQFSASKKSTRSFSMQKNKFLAGLFSVLLIFGFLLTGCPQAAVDMTPPSDDPLGAMNAEEPLITLQPVSRNYESGAAIDPLTVKINPISDGGTVTYQWYSAGSFVSTGGTAISGATGTSYTPTASTGDTYYYVVVNNNNEDAPRNKNTAATSAPARLRIQAGSTAAPAASLTIDPTTKYQYVRGVGAMNQVVWANDNAGQALVDMQDIDAAFNPRGKIRLNMLRVLLAPNLEDHVAGRLPNTNGNIYWDIIKRVNQYGGYVYAVPWTAPRELKTNNAFVGGSLRTDMYQAYAEYLRNFLIRHNEMGAPLYGVSIQNEPDAGVAYDGMLWNATQSYNWHKQVGVYTEGIPGYGGGKPIDRVKIITAETMGAIAFYDPLLDDPEVRKNIDVVARHHYASVAPVAKAYQNGFDADDTKEVWQTEYNDSTSDAAANHPLRATWNWVWFMPNILDRGFRINKESAYIYWFLKRFYGIIGEGEYGTVNHEILPRGYMMGHYARFAADTRQVAISNITGITPRLNRSEWGVDTGGSTGVNDAGRWSSTPKASAYESMDGKSLSLIIFTPSDRSGSGADDLGEIEVKLPWQAASAYALVTDEQVMSDKDKGLREELVVLSADGRSGIIRVPPRTMLSVRFTQAE